MIKIIIELNDEYINIYNKKNKKIYIEKIPPKIIINNKIYDYLQLTKILEIIFNKHNFFNSFFKTKITIILFEKPSPSEIYLINNLFKNISNVILKIKFVNDFFESNHLIISGNIIYNNNKPIKRLNKNQNYILIGYYNDYECLISKLEKKYKINILFYENSNTIIYELL